MARYATGTTTAAATSQAEIQRVLRNAGASHTMLGTGPEGDLIGFQLDGRQYRFSIRRPDLEGAHAAFIAQGGTQWGWSNQTNQPAWIEKEFKRRWRCAVLWVKATIEFAAGDPELLQRSFLGSMALPDGRTFSQWAKPQIDAMYLDGKMPPLLGSGE